MSEGSLSKRFSAQDASFLYFEKEESPLHIGSLGIFEGQVPYDRFVESIKAKLHLIPRYLQRAVPAPFNIGHPSWEWDPDFNIRKHIMRVKIDAPGTDAQLMELAANLFAPKLDRGKPLWELYLVEGLEGDRSAMVSKVHHCLVDGVSGIELLMVMMDVSPDPPPVESKDLGERPPIPNPVRLFTDAAFDSLSQRLDRSADIRRSIGDSLTVGSERGRAIFRALENVRPYATVPVTRAPFNKPLQRDRSIAVTEFSFAEIRGIRQSVGGTVNDVALAVLGGALGRYLEMHGQGTEGRMMRILTPVNVRSEDERGALGNRVSMLLVEVPVGVHDPIERLQKVNARTQALKRTNVAQGTEILGQGINDAPPALQAFLGSLPTPPNTLANLVCTNVPGPMIPLYTVGQRLLSHFPLVPLGWEMGIGVGVTSYNQTLTFGFMASAADAADVTSLKDFVEQSFVELRSAAGVEKSDIPQMGVRQEEAPAAQRRSAGATADSMAADAG
jgi:WS/DGAT/MGAT family acyltransferase